MRKYIFMFIVAIGTFGFAQSVNSDIAIGTVFKIGKSASTKFKHINVPKANMIIKRGGVANYKGLVGRLVVVTSIHKKKNSSTVIRFKLKNGKRFFGSHTLLRANAEKALNSGELILISDKKE